MLKQAIGDRGSSVAPPRRRRDRRRAAAEELIEQTEEASAWAAGVVREAVERTARVCRSCSRTGARRRCEWLCTRGGVHVIGWQAKVCVVLVRRLVRE